MDKSNKIEWNALDHIIPEKNSDWFWVVGIIALSVAILAVFFNNLLFAILIVIGTSIIFITANTPPKIVRFQINRKGVQIGSTLYTYATLKSFYVVDEDGFDRDRLIVRSRKAFMPLIVMPLGEEVTAEEIRNYLLDYLDEEEMLEPTIQRILTRFGL